MTATGDIYESDAVEEMVLSGEFNGRIWAGRFVEAVRRNPQLATDEETMLAWFAAAIMAGYDKARSEHE